MVTSDLGTIPELRRADVPITLDDLRAHTGAGVLGVEIEIWSFTEKELMLSQSEEETVSVVIQSQQNLKRKMIHEFEVELGEPLRVRKTPLPEGTVINPFRERGPKGRFGPTCKKWYGMLLYVHDWTHQEDLAFAISVHSFTRD